MSGREFAPRHFRHFPTFQRGEIAIMDFVHHAANRRQIGQRVEKTVTFLDESRLVLSREEEKHADNAALWYVESSCQTTSTSSLPPCCFHSSNLSITPPPPNFLLLRTDRISQEAVAPKVGSCLRASPLAIFSFLCLSFSLSFTHTHFLSFSLSLSRYISLETRTTKKVIVRSIRWNC